MRLGNSLKTTLSLRLGSLRFEGRTVVLDCRVCVDIRGVVGDRSVGAELVH